MSRKNLTMNEMAYQWFKMYGVEILADPKMQRLTASERSCWLTLLCLASIDNGKVSHCEEIYLMSHSGIDPQSSEWSKTQGILGKFEMLGMITQHRYPNGLSYIILKNWEKRQASAMTGYERLKKHRIKKAQIENDNKMITDDNSYKNRIDKNRIDKIERESETSSFALKKEKKKFGEFENVLLSDLEYSKLSERFTEPITKQMIEEISSYVASRGRKYKDYYAALLGWAQRKNEKFNNRTKSVAIIQ